MANISDAHGTMTFSHPTNDDTSLIQQVINTSMEFYYGELWADKDTKQIWNEPIGFSSSGRWTFYGTLDHFFNYFNEYLSPEQKQQLDKITIAFDYVDYEPGVEYFANNEMTIQAIYDKEDNQLNTKTLSYTHTNVPITAENLVEYEIVDWAADTFTAYGIDALREDVKEVRENTEVIERHYTDIHPQMTRLIENFDKISTEDWLKIFKEQSVDDFVMDTAEDPYQYETLFVDSDAINHPIVKDAIEQ